MKHEHVRERAQKLADRTGQMVLVYRSDYGTHPFHAAPTVPLWGTYTGETFFPKVEELTA